MNSPSTGVVWGRESRGRTQVGGDPLGSSVACRFRSRDGCRSRGGVGGRLDLGNYRVPHQAELGRLERHQGGGRPGVRAETLRPGVDLVRIEVVRAPRYCSLLALALFFFPGEFRVLDPGVSYFGYATW